MRKECIRTPASPVTANAQGDSPPSAVESMLRVARKLHRQAQTGPITTAMPAIRRAYAAGVFGEQALSAVYQKRQTLQRKHFLRTLAIEAGFADWARLLPALKTLAPEAVAHLTTLPGNFGGLNHWFSTHEEAQTFAHAHGREFVAMGQQAMVPGLD